MKLVMSAILVLLLTCLSFAEGDVSGSVGILVEKGKYTPGGFFIEINRKNLGGYISITGDGPEESDFSIANVSIGPTLIVKKRAGVILHLGFQEQVIPIYRIPLLKPQNDPNGQDPPYYNYPPTHETKYYFTYGGGAFIYTVKKFLILHLKYLYVPILREHYIGFGLGMHIYNP